MSKNPLLLDLFCGGGGASQGYSEAGFEVVGVDINPQPHYPFRFIQCDALDFLDKHDLSEFAVIHSSPECKAYTNCNLSPKHNYLKLIGEVRTRLQRTDKLYIIENVMGAKRDMYASLLLCGSMFGLPVQRHRLFESNVLLYAPRACNHANATIGVYGHSIWDSSQPGTTRKDGKVRPSTVPIDVGRKAMGIDWMTIEELAEAIPPAYTAYIGHQLLDILSNGSEVA